jgi:predicted ArsR family transcriptional regulator
MPQEFFDEVMSIAASKIRMEIIDAIAKGTDHPDDLAEKFKITRQAVDKHLTLMFSLGLLERAASYPPDGRPRIVYTLSKGATDLVRDLRSRVQRYADDRHNEYLAEASRLDSKLASGDLSEDAHARKMAQLKRIYDVDGMGKR